MMTKQLVLMLSACVLLACGSEESTRSSGGSLPPAAEVGSQCALANLTRACGDCGGGSQVCGANGTWGACVCVDPASGQTAAGTAGGGSGQPALGLDVTPRGNLDTTLGFEWPESLDSMPGTCEAGRYEGTFDGTYCFSFGNFGAATGGASFGPGGAANCGGSTANPIQGLDPLGGPGLVFDLTSSGNGEIFEITGGTFSGSTNGFIPFSARMEGKLDCSTGKLDAVILDGQYQFAATTYAYEGWIKADYNKATHTLINGTWQVWEPATFNMMGTGNMGAANWGEGTWTAAWVP